MAYWEAGEGAEGPLSRPCRSEKEGGHRPPNLLVS